MAMAASYGEGLEACLSNLSACRGVGSGRPKTSPSKCLGQVLWGGCTGFRFGSITEEVMLGRQTLKQNPVWTARVLRYSAAISSCRKGAHWQKALDLLQDVANG